MPSLTNNKLSNDLCPEPLYKPKFFYNGKVRYIAFDKVTPEFIDKTWVNAVNTVGETPLHMAAAYNHIPLVKFMLPYCANLHSTDRKGNTFLHLLANHSIEDKVKIRKKRTDILLNLITKGIKVNQRNNKGWTVTHFAAKHCHIDLLKILQKRKADFSLKTNTNETPLILACKHMKTMKNTPIEKQAISFLIKYVSDINALDDEGCSALHYAAERCSSATVIKLLKYGADIHLRSEEHNLTPLHFSLMKDKHNYFSVTALLKAGATLESKEIDELTPLQIAVLGGSSEVVGYLIDNGADVNYPDKILQLTPLYLAFYQQRLDLFEVLIKKGADVNCIVKDDLSILDLTSMLGSYEFTKALIDGGANVNCSSDDQFTPLHLAAMKSPSEEISKLIISDAVREGHKESLIVELLTYPWDEIVQNHNAVIELLLNNGADVNALTLNGCSSLHFAVEFGYYSIVKILIEHGANVDDKDPSSGLTPLQTSLINNFESIVELLINAGSDVNALLPNGKSPLNVALDKNSTEVLKLLVSAGANVNYEEPISKLKPLQLALLNDKKAAAEILINVGADVHVLTKNGKSSIHLHLESSSRIAGIFSGGKTYVEPKDILELLVNRGVDVNYVDPNSKLTLLHLSLMKGYKYIAEILIEAGANVNALTPNGESPLHLALEFKCKRVLIDLIKRGAELNCKSTKCLYTVFSVISQINEKDALDADREIQNVIGRLSDLVDTHDKTSLAIMNSNIFRCCIGKLICYHEDCEFNPHDSEIYNRFISYRVLSRTFQKFNDDESSYKYFADYIFMLKILTGNFDAQEPITPLWETYSQKDLHRLEVEQLKNYWISDGITLYDLINMKPSIRRFHTRNLNLFDIQAQFKIYYKLILAYYYEDKVKAILLETIYTKFPQLVNVSVPIICMDRIFWDLDVIDIISTIEAGGTKLN